MARPASKVYLYDVPDGRMPRGMTFVPAMAEFLTEWPEGWIIADNHVRPPGFPKVPLGFNGFRAWFARPRARYVRCRCGWAPHLGTHYRVRRS